MYEGTDKNDFKKLFDREYVEIYEEKGDKLEHVYCRVVFRTPVTNLRSDMNGLDLYTVSYIIINKIS